MSYDPNSHQQQNSTPFAFLNQRLLQQGQQLPQGLTPAQAQHLNSAAARGPLGAGLPLGGGVGAGGQGGAAQLQAILATMQGAQMQNQHQQFVPPPQQQQQQQGGGQQLNLATVAEMVRTGQLVRLFEGQSGEGRC